MPKIKKVTTKNINNLEADYKMVGELYGAEGLYIVVDFGSEAVLGVAGIDTITAIWPYIGMLLENGWVEYTKEDRLA